MMLALYRKDLRLNRAPVIGALVLSLVFYVIPVVALAWSPPATGLPRDYYLMGVSGGAGTGLWLTMVMCAVFGGVAFAPERRDRSAELLAMLPVRRWAIAFSKLLAAGTCVLGLCAVHALILALCFWGSSAGQPFLISAEVVRIYAEFPCMGILLFGLGWLFSTFLSSPTFAAVLSMVCSAVVAGVLTGMVALWIDAHHTGSHAYDNLFLATSVVAAALGLACLAAGTVYYRARVSP